MEGGCLRAQTLPVAKRFLVRSSLPESCSSPVSVPPPLTRQVPSVLRSPGDGWLDPASEDFKMTKVMTLQRGKLHGLGSQPLDGSAKEPGCGHAMQQGHAVNHHMSRVSLQLALLPGASLDKARSLHRVGTQGASLSPWDERSLPLACVRVSAVSHFWGFRRRSHLSVSSPSWQSHLLLS